MKNFYALLLGAMLASILIFTAGSDIQRSITFSDGSTLSAAQLNGLIDNATISTGFYTARPSEPVLGGADVFLVYSPTLAGYYKVTANQVLYQNVGFFTNLTQVTFAATNDLISIYSTANATVGAINPINLMSNSLPWAFRLSTNMPPTNVFFFGNQGGSIDTNSISIGGVNSSYSLLKIFQTGLQFSTPTNLPSITVPTNNDTELFWTTTDNTNYTAKATTRIAQYTNSPAATNLAVFSSPTPTISAGAAFFAVVPQVSGVTNFTYVTNVAQNSTVTNIFTNATLTLTDAGLASNAPIQTVTFRQLQQWLTNNPLPTYPVTFTSPLSVALALGVATNFSHGFQGTPALVRCVLVCQTSDASYSVGDEVDASGFSRGDGTPFVTYGANTTNVFFTIQNGNTPLTLDKFSGAAPAITLSRWKAKIYARLNLLP